MRALALCLTLLAIAPAASADSVAIGAAEFWRGGSYLGAGAISSLPGSRLGRGWAAKAWIDRSEYEYLGAPGLVRGVAVGEEISLGRMASGDGWSASGWVGAAHRDTSLSPFDPSSESSGSQSSLKLQADLSAASGPLLFEGILSWHPGFGAYWSRARASLPVSSTLRAGLEASLQGDPSYSARSAGLFLSCRLSESVSVGAKAGARWSDEDSAYGGLEIAFSF